MKRPLIILLVAALGFAAFSVVNANRRAARQAQEAAWQAAKAERAAELARADTQKKIAIAPIPAPVERTSEPSALPPASPPKTEPMKPAIDLNVKTQAVAAAFSCSAENRQQKAAASGSARARCAKPCRVRSRCGSDLA